MSEQFPGVPKPLSHPSAHVGIVPESSDALAEGPDKGIGTLGHCDNICCCEV